MSQPRPIWLTREEAKRHGLKRRWDESPREPVTTAYAAILPLRGDAYTTDIIAVEVVRALGCSA